MNTSRRPLEDRLWEKACESSDGCWIWQGSRNPVGYGQIRAPGRRGALLAAHRVAYEFVVGLIPAGLTIDHLCRNTSCINPAHMEPVTLRENIRRGAAVQTHCKYGHPLDGRMRDKKMRSGWARYCKTCLRHRNHRRHAMRVAAEVLVPPEDRDAFVIAGYAMLSAEDRKAAA